MSRKSELEALAQDFACAIEQLGRLGAQASHRALTPSMEEARAATKRAAVSILVRMLYKASELEPPLEGQSGNRVD